jgi:hypothetical protein
MNVITKIFRTYVSLKNLGVSLGKIHYSLRSNLNLFFPWGIIMSLGRSLNCPKEQLKHFFLKNNHVPEEELKLRRKTT